MRCNRCGLISGTAILLAAFGVFATADRACSQVTSTDAPTTARDIRIAFTNEGNSSFSLTPLWFGFHDGSFDAFDLGAPASTSLEMLAEDGIVDGLVDDFTAASSNGNRQGVVFAPQGFGGAPVVEPGETGRAYIALTDESTTPYFSFASMVIPSNDTFVGNSNPIAYEVFDAMSQVSGGTFTIELRGSDLYDSGTEDNIGMGAAFSAIGGTASDTVGGVIGAAGDLSEFLNTDTPAGTTITELIGQDDLVATVTITRIPEPSAVILAAFSIAMLISARSFRRRRAAHA